MRLWIDTDLGSDVDDALTLAYALRHPGFEVVGVSTVFGDVALRTRITRALLNAAGGSAPEIPVVTGLGVPLTPKRPGRMFGHEGRGIVDDALPLRKVTAEPDAGDRVASLAGALEAAAPDVIVAIGPLTNLGALAREGIGLAQLVIMGGKLRDVMLPGMVPQVPEWNWYCDPHAVQAVLAAAHPKPPRVVPAEVTFGTNLPEAEIRRLEAGDALARAIGVLSREWLSAQSEFLGARKPRVALHDPLTAATLQVAGLCDFEQRSIRVDDGGATRDAPGTGARVEAAISVDNDALVAHLMETWLG